MACVPTPPDDFQSALSLRTWESYIRGQMKLMMEDQSTTPQEIRDITQALKAVKDIQTFNYRRNSYVAASTSGNPTSATSDYSPGTK